MARPSIGQRPPRYSFMLNPYTDTRLSKCPRCEKPTHLRKFALLIHIEHWGPLALGKTCRYCSKCELIIVHQDELEVQLAQTFSELAPEMIGNEYLVLGTIEKKVWQQGLRGQGQPMGEILKHAAQFKHYYELKYEPAGWYPTNHKTQNE